MDDPVRPGLGQRYGMRCQCRQTDPGGLNDSVVVRGRGRGMLGGLYGTMLGGTWVPACPNASPGTAPRREYCAASQPCGQQGRENDLSPQAAVFVSTAGGQSPSSHATPSCDDRGQTLSYNACRHSKEDARPWIRRSPWFYCFIILGRGHSSSGLLP